MHRHLQSFLVIYFCCLVVSPIFGAQQLKSNTVAEELLFLRYEGGIFSRIKWAELLIRNNGFGVTRFERKEKGSAEIPLQLDQDELEAMKTLIDATDFFSQKQGRVAYTDVGWCTLRISMNGKQHELHFDRIDPRLEPLTRFTWGLIRQSIAISDIKEQRDVYWAKGTVKPYGRGGQYPKAPQPKTLREPLKDFIRKSENRQQLIWAIEALSSVTTEDEWMGFLSRELNSSKGARKILLLEALSSHPFTGNIPTSHHELLAPLFLKNLRLEYRNWPQFSKEKQQAYGSVIRFLGGQCYIAAIPILVEMVEKSYTNYPDSSWVDWSLSFMPVGAINPLKLLLDSPNSEVRARAAQIFGKILVMNPGPPDNAIVEEQRKQIKKQILNRLRNEVAPILKRLSKDDPDDWVRKAAKRSLQQIERGWNK